MFRRVGSPKSQLLLVNQLLEYTSSLVSNGQNLIAFSGGVDSSLVAGKDCSFVRSFVPVTSIVIIYTIYIYMYVCLHTMNLMFYVGC